MLELLEMPEKMPAITMKMLALEQRLPVPTPAQTRTDRESPMPMPKLEAAAADAPEQEEQGARAAPEAPGAAAGTPIEEETKAPVTRARNPGPRTATTKWKKKTLEQIPLLQIRSSSSLL